MPLVFMRETFWGPVYISLTWYMGIWILRSCRFGEQKKPFGKWNWTEAIGKSCSDPYRGSMPGTESIWLGMANGYGPVEPWKDMALQQRKGLIKDSAQSAL